MLESVARGGQLLATTSSLDKIAFSRLVARALRTARIGFCRRNTRHTFTRLIINLQHFFRKTGLIILRKVSPLSKSIKVKLFELWLPVEKLVAPISNTLSTSRGCAILRK